jgi:hypothetical protein
MLSGCQDSSGPAAPDGIRLGASFLLRVGESAEIQGEAVSKHQPRNADHAGHRTTLRRVLPAASRAGERMPLSEYIVELQVDR